MSETDDIFDEGESRVAKLYTYYGVTPTIEEAIRQAKERHAAQFAEHELRDLDGKKWDSGWDDARSEPYWTIAVTLERGYDS